MSRNNYLVLFWTCAFKAPYWLIKTCNVAERWEAEIMVLHHAFEGDSSLKPRECLCLTEKGRGGQFLKYLLYLKHRSIPLSKYEAEHQLQTWPEPRYTQDKPASGRCYCAAISIGFFRFPLHPVPSLFSALLAWTASVCFTEPHPAVLTAGGARDGEHTFPSLLHCRIM